ncbi:sugar MFS transporter [Flavobacterium sp. W21_SRS_FM6]|uniref:sugar MFS transporter n=1 Tax=Flavobacterium sp. W21_SRS_FM6 TaxID=3240268 RepID=UPI003F90CED9
MQSSQSNVKISQKPEGLSIHFAFAAMTSLFFIWGFITALNDILLPYLKGAFSLSYLQAGLVQFCFFGAYFIVSPFAGRMLEKVGYKNGIIIGLGTVAAGCCLFFPAAEAAIYAVFLFALFVLAAGIAILQVSANPYVAVLGSEETAASRLNFAQAINSLGHTAGPAFGAILILSAVEQSGSAKAVQLPYLLIAVALVVVALVFYKLKLPNISEHLDESKAASHFTLFSHKHLTYGVLAIFLYVGAEVAVGSYLVNFFMQLGIEDMTTVTAGKMVSYYWGAAMVGRFAGALIMRYVAPTTLLAINSVLAVAMIIVAVNSSGEMAMWTILAVGFFNSIMFPTIFTLAIRGLGEHTGRGSGYLCQGIVGGAILPMIQGQAADMMTLQWSFLIPAVCYLYIAWYALRGSRVSVPVGESASDAEKQTKHPERS